ncbi:cyclase family protein [Methyloterricola oryzae]|uniref:cyclase family protein n=1 Tax=Methyloterricola oryzae TaxID=1495050 RepID=UPI0005EBC2A9|nr:cyclase family protein [Methyloterricola oryzae]
MLILSACGPQPVRERGDGLWPVYEGALKYARYIDLTHAMTPSMPVWKGFGPSRFGPASDPATGRPYRYGSDGFEATHYDLSTDQLGTQLDPPAHWAPEFPAIDELPATFEARHGRIPEGAVVMVRSDWSKAWPYPRLAAQTRFPGVSLAALQWLHTQRHILMHGHEPLDTDSTPTLEGEHWLMHQGYAQAEGVAHLDQVPETGCLVSIGYAKFKGGLGGYARYIAICPEDSAHGLTIREEPGAPLPKLEKPLRWDPDSGVRVRR